MLRGLRGKLRKKKQDASDDAAVPEENLDDETLLDDEEWDDLDYEEDDEEKPPLKTRILRGLRNAAISVVVLLVLAVGGGVGYVWYMGENNVPATAAEPPAEPVIHREVKRTKRDPKAPFGASVQMLSTPVIPGSNAQITVKTAPEVDCKIVVEVDKKPLQDSGLVDRKADDFGMVTWSWTLPADTKLGKWPVNVTCTSPVTKKSAFVRGDMEVVRTLPED